MAADPARLADAAPRILLVDDEVSALEVLALILRGEGMHVTTAHDGRQALLKLEDAAPQLVVTDFMMPGMNGADLVRAIRGVERYGDVPVLLVSGAPESALRPYRTAYDAFLRKPFGLDQFLAAVNELLQSRGTPRQARGA